MLFAGGNDIVQFRHAQIIGPLCAFQVDRKGRGKRPAPPHRPPHDGIGVGELRDHMRRHKGGDLYFRHPGCGGIIEPFQFDLSGDKGFDQLQAIAKPDFPNVNVCHAILLNCPRTPFTTDLAAAPSCWSSVATSGV